MKICCVHFTLGRDGYPRVMARWFFLNDEDGIIKLSLNTSRQNMTLSLSFGSPINNASILILIQNKENS